MVTEQGGWTPSDADLAVTRRTLEWLATWTEGHEAWMENTVAELRELAGSLPESITELEGE